MRGAVWDGNRLIVTDRLRLRRIEPGEVRIRVLRSGVCHTDIAKMGQNLSNLPVVFGHEACGEIIEVGENVEQWCVGDRVITSTQTPCGACRECQRDEPHSCPETWGTGKAGKFPYSLDDTPVASFANVSSFAGEIVAKTGQLFKADGLPPEAAALIGCAVSTGVCAARRLGQVRQADTVVVFGIGGVGVNAVQGAAAAGATVIAVDTNPSREAVARGFGASAFVLADRALSAESLATDIASRFGPIDVVIECSGSIGAIEAALNSIKRGGRVVLIGMSRPSSHAALPLDTFVRGGEVIAAMNGGAVPERDYPEIILQVRDGRLNVSDQVSAVWPIERINEAIIAVQRGEVTRAVIDHEI